MAFQATISGLRKSIFWQATVISMVLLMSLVTVTRGQAPRANKPAPPPPRSESIAWRTPGEFEQQEYLILCCGALSEEYARTMIEIIDAVESKIRVVVLYSHSTQRQLLSKAMLDAGLEAEHAKLVFMPHDTRWVRDFGPTEVRLGKSARFVDWEYGNDRPNDERFPQALAERTAIECESSSLVFEGGNLISNGKGLSLTTTALIDANEHLFAEPGQLIGELARVTGSEQVVVLEPMAGESTGHIDMFAVFVDARTVVVGRFDPGEDPENAEILDRNASLLARIDTAVGKLNVERIPMGANRDGVFRTYTNCIFSNGVLVVPAYEDVDRHVRAEVAACYRRLLPDWQIKFVDATELIQWGGALHCASLTLGSLPQGHFLQTPSIVVPESIPANDPVTPPLRSWEDFWQPAMKYNRHPSPINGMNKLGRMGMLSDVWPEGVTCRIERVSLFCSVLPLDSLEDSGGSAAIDKCDSL